MQPRYYNELDHLRTASQRPQPSRSLDRPSLTATATSPILRTHTRTQSAISPEQSIEHSDSKGKSHGFDRNGGGGGGWLEPSAPVQLTASISSPSFPHPNTQYLTTSTATAAAIPGPKVATTTTKETIDGGHTKGRLGAVSNEDILKLTHLTNQLPEVSRKHNHIQKRPKQSKRRPCFGEDAPQVPDADHQHYYHPTSDIPNNSQTTDAGFADLLNQDFIKSSSSPASDTIISGNPSAFSTDTGDSQFSFQSSNINSRSNHDPNSTGAEPPLAEQPRPNNQNAAASTTALGYDLNLTPSSSQDSRSNRRSWYKTLMKRDKKGKAKSDDSPMTNSDEQALDSNHDDTDADASPIHTLHHQDQPTSTIETNNHEFTNHRSQTHPVVDTTTNRLLPSHASPRKQHTHLSIRRLRLPSRHRHSNYKSKEPRKTDIKNGTDNTQESHAIGSNKRFTTGINRGDRKLRLRLYSRRHSFDNMREYDLVPGGTPTDGQADTTTPPNSINMGRSNSQQHQQQQQQSSMSSSSSSPPRPSSIPPPRAPSTYLVDTSPWSASSVIPSISTSSPAYNATSALAVGISKPETDDVSSVDDSFQQDAPDFSNTDPIKHKQHLNLSQIEGVDDTRLGPDDALDLQQQAMKRVLYFDYHSLPGINMLGEPKGVKALVKAMIDNGYGTLAERRIIPDEDDDDDDDDDNDDDDGLEDDIAANGDGDNNDDANGNTEETGDADDNDPNPPIESSKIITGDTHHYLAGFKTKTRQIAEIRVDEDNDLGFIKLSQLADEASHVKGALVNLYVSFLAAPGKTEDDLAIHIQDSSILCKNVNDRLLSLDPFIDNAKAFLKERKQEYRAFVPMEESSNDMRAPSKQSDSDTGVRFASTDSSRSSSLPSIGPLSPKNQGPLTSSLSSSSLVSTATTTTTATVRPPSLSSSHRSGSSTFQQSLWNYVPYQEYNAYEYRQDQLKDAVSDLRRGIDEFKRSLLETEELVHGVQIDMNDTKAKMDTYLKDVPETHYSELKRLEISIESILANRAKSRGMELLYWLLTALLTGCAFLLWAIIYVLKLGQTAISFPRKMFRAFNEHMEERNKVVKQASMRIVAKGADRPPSFSSSRPSLTPSMDQPSVRPPGSSRRRSSRRASIPSK